MEHAQAETGDRKIEMPGVTITVHTDDPEVARAKEMLREQGYQVLRKGRNGLSESEQRVQALVVEGYSNKEVAHLLKITEATVKVHLKSILRRHNLGNRTQLAVYVKTGTRPASAPA